MRKKKFDYVMLENQEAQSQVFTIVASRRIRRPCDVIGRDVLVMLAD
jgi:hypothetical protein